MTLLFGQQPNAERWPGTSWQRMCRDQLAALVPNGNAGVANNSYVEWEQKLDQKKSIIRMTRSKDAIVATWRVKALQFDMSAKEETVEIARDTLENEVDLMGWITFVKNEMIRLTCAGLVPLFNGTNVLPDGYAEAKKIVNQKVAPTASLYGVTHREAAAHVAQQTWPLYHPLWKVKNARYFLEFEVLDRGSMAARLLDERTVQWRICFPSHMTYVGKAASRIMFDHEGTMHIKSDENVAKTLMREFVYQITVNHLKTEDLWT